MNVERRRRQLLALINDPATFEGERENARRALERLDAKAPPPQAADDVDVESPWYWTYWNAPPPRAADFAEMIRRFQEAAETRSRAGAGPPRDDTSGYRAAAEGGAYGPIPSDDDDEWGIHL